MNEWITSVEVRNFRGIREVKLSNGEIGRVNLIVGRSNSCKSALLEAIALSAPLPAFRDALGTHLPAWIVARRGRPYSARSLIRFGAEEAFIGAKFAGGREAGVTLFTEGSASFERYKGAVSWLAERVGGGADDAVYAVASGGGRDSAFAVAVSGDKVVVVETSDGGRAGYVAFADPHLATDHDALARAIDAAILRGVMPEEVVGEYRHAIGKRNRVEGIRIGYSGAVYVKLEGAQYAPYNTLGHGLRMSLFCALVEKLVQGGVVLIDSPDFLHPSLVNHLVAQMAKSQSQYFVATNSLDSIHVAIDLASELGKLDELRVVRMSDCELADVLKGGEAYFKSAEVG